MTFTAIKCLCLLSTNISTFKRKRYINFFEDISSYIYFEAKNISIFHSFKIFELVKFNYQGESSSLCWLTKGEQLYKGTAVCTVTAVAQWLRCSATNREVAGSIPAGVRGFFIDIKSFQSHLGPGVDLASNRNVYQEHFLGLKAAGA